MKELDELETQLGRGEQLHDQKIIDKVQAAAAHLEHALPGRRMKTLLRDGGRGRARELKEKAAKARAILAARGELYREPPPAIPVRERRLPDGKDAVPLYVDSHALLSLLAARKNGFSAVETRTVTSEHRREWTRSGGFKFEIAPLDMLKLGPSLSAEKSSHDSTTEGSTGDVYQTEGSLLYQLLDDLKGEIAVVNGDNWSRIGDFHFVELHARLRPNPWVAYLTAQRRLVDIAEPLACLRGDGRRKSERLAAARRIASYREFLDTALGALQQGGPLPLLGEIQVTQLGELQGKPSPRVVVPIFPEYVRDPSLAEVTHGVVAIIGTVRDKLDPPPSEPGATDPAELKHAEEKWAADELPLVPSALLTALSQAGLETVYLAAEELSNEVRRSATLVKPKAEYPPIVRGPALDVAPLAILASRAQQTERPAATEDRVMRGPQVVFTHDAAE